MMCSLIGWLWANDNSSLLLPSRPRCPLSSQNTHSALLSSSPVSQPPLHILEEGFSELVDRILGFRQIELGLGFKSWLNRTSSPRQPLEVGRPTYCACPICFEDLEICDAKQIGTALRRLGTCFPMSVSYIILKRERQVNQEAKGLLFRLSEESYCPPQSGNVESEARMQTGMERRPCELNCVMG